MNRSESTSTSSNAATEMNGFAIASLVLGIVWVMGIGSILALVFGYTARGQITASRGTQSGLGLATAGIVLGWVGVGLVLAAIALMAVGWFAWPMTPMMRGARPVPERAPTGTVSSRSAYRVGGSQMTETNGADHSLRR